MARGSRPPGNGTKRPFVVQRELFLISKMWVFFLLKKEIENTPSLQRTLDAGQPGRRGGAAPAQGRTPALAGAAAVVRPPACDQVDGRQGRVSESRSALRAEGGMPFSTGFVVSTLRGVPIL